MNYIDTSLLVAAYLPESKSVKVQALLSKTIPAISLLTEVEFCSAVAKKTRLHEIDKDQAQEVIALFNSHLEDDLFKRVGVTTQHFHFARYCLSKLQTSLRALDALHMAIASIEELTLITADTELAKAARFFSVACKKL